MTSLRASDLLGKLLERYRVVEFIGAGGMANVYLARADGLGGFRKWVAIKVMHGELLQKPELANLLLDEARLAARITHPNVVNVFDLGRDGDLDWIAMEYLSGESLRDVLLACDDPGHPALPVELAAHIASEAAEGLHAAHELVDDEGKPLGLVHRDVSPDNIFVTDDGMVKVTDFGIAKAADRVSRTVAGTLKGKVAYMSPERALGLDVDRRADIFALGAVLWEALAFKRLFRAASHEETLRRVVEERVEPPSHHRKDCPRALDEIVLRALAKQPADRYRTAQDLSRALRKFLLEAAPDLDRSALARFLRDNFSDAIELRQQRLRAAAARWSDTGPSAPTVDIGPAPNAAQARTAPTLQSPASPVPSIAKPESAPTLLDDSSRSERASEANSGGGGTKPVVTPRAQRGRFVLAAVAAVLAFGAVGLVLIPIRTQPALPSAQPAAYSAPIDRNTALLSVTCRPACSRVSVDGRDVGRDGAERVSLAPGRHSVVCTSKQSSQRLSVVLEAGQETRLRVDFD